MFLLLVCLSQAYPEMLLLEGENITMCEIHM